MTLGKKLKSAQYKAALPVTGAIKDTLRNFNNFKNKQRSVWSSIQYTIH